MNLRGIRLAEVPYHEDVALVTIAGGVPLLMDGDTIDALNGRMLNNYYIIARDGDTYKSIKKETGVSKRKILKYNELPAQHELAAGDILYLERKQKHASREYKDKLIVVKSGDSYYSIAQRFGIRLKDLYKMNCLPPDAEIQEGQMLFVYR